MPWKTWGYYSVALVATLLACWLWIFVLGEARVPSVVGAVSAPSTTPAADPVPIVPHVAPPMPRPLQQACVAGVKWFYDDVHQRWSKSFELRTGRPLPCDLGTVRSENDREGLIVRHPKGWRPGSL